MAENRITRETYRQYAHKIVSVLKNEEFYEQFKKRVDKGSSSFKLAKKRLIQDISIDWIDTIEDVLPNLDTIVRNPRKFIVQEEDIVDVSLARSISTESVKFLAQHTNMISKVDKDGSVTPSKILNITKEESFEIYENRFIYTLLLKLKDFVTMRYDKIKKASATQDVLELDIESRFNLPSKKVTFRTEYFAQLSFDEVMRLDPDTLTKIERIAKIDRIITDFLSSSFAKSMRNSAPVRPPIMRTNVILKEPNFKKALTLWQFIETYNVTAGFSTSDEVEGYDVDEESQANLKNMVTLSTMLFESIYDQSETDMDMEDKEFADFLRVGEMDFDKDEISRDEYAQKLDEKQENEEEQENIEEAAPNEDGEADSGQDKEEQPEDAEERRKEKEIIVETAEERPVEVERIKEVLPKAEQEEVDIDPDAERFDAHLYDVRKLYMRPSGDALSYEDIVKVNDAIDRCLTSYRRVKQEEIDDRNRSELIRRRREDMQKRAAALKKLRFSLEGKVSVKDSSDVRYGIDPISYQRAKIAAAKQEEERTAARLAAIAERERLAKEKLALEEKKDDGISEAADDSAQTLSADLQNEESVTDEGSVTAAQNDAVAKEAVPAKQSKPRKPKTIPIIDESKVGVGGLRISKGKVVEDPFGSKVVFAKQSGAEGGAQSQAQPKPRKPRAKKEAAQAAEDGVAGKTGQQPQKPRKPSVKEEDTQTEQEIAEGKAEEQPLKTDRKDA